MASLVNDADPGAEGAEQALKALAANSPYAVKVPAFDDDLPFASVASIEVKEGDSYEAGDIVAKIMVGDEIIDVPAEKSGEVVVLKTFAGGMVNANETIIEGVKPATGAQTASSFFSAVLGTIAFSALTMLFWIRKTNLVEWILLVPGTILLYWPTLITDAAGIVIVGVVIFSQITRNKKDKAKLAAA